MILSDLYILKNHVKINKIKLYVSMQIIFLLVEVLVFYGRFEQIDDMSPMRHICKSNCLDENISMLIGVIYLDFF